MAGYIKLHRGWHDSSQFANEPYCERAAWCWLLTSAAWKDATRRNHKGEIVTVQRGQFHTSLRVLSAEWKWSIKRVRTFLKVLEKCEAIGTIGAHGGTTITICKYEEYQSSGRDGGTRDGTLRAQSGHIQEEGKEVKEEKNNKAYAFDGSVIRLTSKDFDLWEKAYSGMDLRAALQSRDDWLSGQDQATQKKWFNSTSNWLAQKKQQAVKAEREEDEWTFTGPC